MRKAVLATFLIIVLLNIFVTPFKAGAIQVAESFFMKDISGHWGEEDVNNLSYMGIIKGDGDLNARPNDKITRAEFTAFLVRALDSEGYYPRETTYFKDVEKNAWYYNAIAVAKEEGIVVGDDNKYFSPNKNISREEIVLMLVRATQLNDTTNTIDFRDISKDYKYSKELSKALGNGLIKGYNDNMFRPNNMSTRAEALTMISRMLRTVDNPLINRNDRPEIEALIKKYLLNYIAEKNSKNADLSFNISKAVGREKDTISAKDSILRLFKENKINVTVFVEDINISAVEITGDVAVVQTNYRAVYSREFNDGKTRDKSYIVNTKLSLIKRNDGWKIYNTEESLSKEEKINLVWEMVSARTPDMTNVDKIKGLNVVSPTWFDLRFEEGGLNSFEERKLIYAKDSKRIYMVDRGDKAYVNWAHQNGYDVWGLFKNEFDIEVAHKVLNDSEARRKSIEMLLQYSQKYELDGINIDLEKIYYTDRNKLSQYVREMSLVFRELGMVTSVDVTKIEKTSLIWSMCYDRKALGEAVDYVALMAYDQNGSWSEKGGSVAQISWVEGALIGILEQVDNRKLLLGVPFYTRIWEEINNKVVSTRAISMMEAQSLIKANNATVKWDEQSGQYFASYINGARVYKIWLEDARSIGLKSALVNKYDLSGTAAWRRGFETSDIWDVLSLTQ